MKICLCHQMDPRNPISRQATLQKYFIESRNDFVLEVKTKTSTPLNFSCLFRIFLSSRKSDVIHVHTCSYWGFISAFYGLLVSKLINKKIVLTYHGGHFISFYKKYRFLLGPVIREFDLIMVPSTYLKNNFERFGFEKISLVHNSIIDNRFFRVNRIIKSRPKPFFIIVRNLTDIYRVQDAIEAFGNLKERYPHSRLLILGDGSQRKKLENLVIQKNINGIKFLGKVDYKRMYHYYWMADIAINTAAVDNMPVSVYEAMAHGLFVISTDVGGIPEIIENGQSGILVPPGSPDEIYRAMLSVLNNHRFYKQATEKARDFARQNISPEAISEQLYSAYSKVYT